MASAAINGVYTNGHANGHANGHPSAAVSPTEAVVDPTAARRRVESVRINSPLVAYTQEHIISSYTYHGADVVRTANGGYDVHPTAKTLEFMTERKVPKTGSVHLTFCVGQEFDRAQTNAGRLGRQQWLDAHRNYRS
jgi:myo-inositol-1-phosphate synthase